MSDSKLYSFYDTDADQYGVTAALVLNRIRWLCAKNKTDGRNLRKGQHWTFDSVKDIASQYTFLTRSMVREALDLLIKHGAILVGNYNRNAFDRTRWFTLATGNKTTPQPTKSAFAKPDKTNSDGEENRPFLR